MTDTRLYGQVVEVAVAGGTPDGRLYSQVVEVAVVENPLTSGDSLGAATLVAFRR